MKCCNNCGPLKGGPIGPSCPDDGGGGDEGGREHVDCATARLEATQQAMKAGHGHVGREQCLYLSVTGEASTLLSSVTRVKDIVGV